MIKKRRILITVIFIILFIAFAIKAWVFPLYEADALIMVDIKEGPTSTESRRLDMNQMAGVIRTHINLLQSPLVIRSVVEDLKLDRDIADDRSVGIFNKFIKAGFKSVPPSQESNIRAMIGILQKKYITISSPPFTNLIEIKVKYKDPRHAAEIANVLVDNYINWTINFFHQEVDKIIAYLDQEIILAKNKLAASETALKEFKEQNNIVYLPEEMTAYVNRQVRLETEYSYADVEEKEEMTRQASLEKKIRLKVMDDEITKASGDISLFALLATDNPLIQEFEKELLGLEIELSRIKELYNDESPQVRFMEKRIVDLKEKINFAIRKMFESKIAISSLNPVYQQMVRESIELEVDLLSLRAKKQALRTLLDSYAKELKNFPRKEVILARLVRALKINENTYTFLLEEKDKASLLQAKKTSENIKVVSPAAVPLKPKGRLTNLILGAVAALFIAITITFGLEIKTHV